MEVVRGKRGTDRKGETMKTIDEREFQRLYRVGQIRPVQWYDKNGPHIRKRENGELWCISIKDK